MGSSFAVEAVLLGPEEVLLPLTCVLPKNLSRILRSSSRVGYEVETQRSMRVRDVMIDLESIRDMIGREHYI